MEDLQQLDAHHMPESEQAGLPVLVQTNTAVDRVDSIEMDVEAYQPKEDVPCSNASEIQKPRQTRLVDTNPSQQGHVQGREGTDSRHPEHEKNQDQDSASSDSSDVVPLPDKRYGRVLRNLRWTIFSVYRRLCISVIVGNIIAMIVVGANHDLFKLPKSVPHISTAVAVNLTVTVLMRQEYVVNALFVTFGQLPQNLPLKVRHLAAKVYHYGGIHSGAGISSFLWFLLFNNAIAKLCRGGQTPRGYKIGILFFMSLIDVFFILIIVFAEPKLRGKVHNVWETTHRFAGWMCIGSFWVLFGLLAKVQSEDEKQSVGHVFLHSPTFWCLLIISISLILPWLRLRSVPVEPVQLSDHAVSPSFPSSILLIRVFRTMMFTWCFLQNSEPQFDSMLHCSYRIKAWLSQENAIAFRLLCCCQLLCSNSSKTFDSSRFKF